MCSRFDWNMFNNCRSRRCYWNRSWNKIMPSILVPITLASSDNIKWVKNKAESRLGTSFGTDSSGQCFAGEWVPLMTGFIGENLGRDHLELRRSSLVNSANWKMVSPSRSNTILSLSRIVGSIQTHSRDISVEYQGGCQLENGNVIRASGIIPTYKFTPDWNINCF